MGPLKVIYRFVLSFIKHNKTSVTGKCHIHESLYKINRIENTIPLIFPLFFPLSPADSTPQC